MRIVQHIINKIVEGGGIGSSKKRKQGNIGFNNPEQYPRVPSGFQCFVCGKQYSKNEERIQHLQEESHGSMYDTVSPQESEDIRRLKAR